MKKLLTILKIQILLTTFCFSTGASIIDVTIEPFSINNNGDVICKTRFSINRMGAHDFMPIDYGFLLILISERKIEQFPYIKFEPGNYSNINEIIKKRSYYENIFSNEINYQNPPKSISTILKKYNFISNNVSLYKKMSIIHHNDIKNYFSNSKLIQLSLDNRKSYREFNQNILLKYDFPNLIILNNFIDDFSDESTENYGSYFNWKIKYEEKLIDFEIINIDGIIFKDK